MLLRDLNVAVIELNVLKNILWSRVLATLVVPILFIIMIQSMFSSVPGPEFLSADFSDLSIIEGASIETEFSNDTTSVKFLLTSPANKNIEITRKNEEVFSSGPIEFNETGYWTAEITAFSKRGKTKVIRQFFVGDCLYDLNCADDATCETNSCTKLNCDTCSSIQNHACLTSCSAGELCCSSACFTPNVCTANEQCEDGSTQTVDTCTNIGACGNACVSEIPTCSDNQVWCYGSCKTPFCDEDIDCNDQNNNTIDSCINRGSCAAQCEYKDAGCNNACTGSQACCGGTCGIPNSCTSDVNCTDESNYTLDICMDSKLFCGKFCKSETPSCPEGQTWCLGECKSNFCKKDADCDDSNSTTTDVCVLPNTCSATCVHI